MYNITIHITATSWQEAKEQLICIELYANDLKEQNPFAVVSVEVELNPDAALNRVPISSLTH